MMTVNRNLGTYALKLFRKIFMDMPLGIRMRNSSTLLLLIKILLTNKYVIETNYKIGLIELFHQLMI